MGTPAYDICAGCGLDMTFEPDQYVSQLYNPTNEPDFLLCPNCADREDEAVEEEGTNDIPRMVERYRNRVCSV